MEELMVKIKCFFGKHNYKLSYYNDEFGFAYGGKCEYCGSWSKTALRGPHKDFDKHN